MQMQGQPVQQQLQPELVPPTQDPNWDNLDYKEQNKRIDEFQKKGGKLMG